MGTKIFTQYTTSLSVRFHHIYIYINYLIKKNKIKKERKKRKKERKRRDK
jgi:hypothetical protein